jgi:hypothetical protein
MNKLKFFLIDVKMRKQVKIKFVRIGFKYDEKCPTIVFIQLLRTFFSSKKSTL